MVEREGMRESLAREIVASLAEEEMLAIRDAELKISNDSQTQQQTKGAGDPLLRVCRVYFRYLTLNSGLLQSDEGHSICNFTMACRRV